jgi:uncharacterized membrane protein
MISYALANKKFILAVISYALANKKFILAVISYALAMLDIFFIRPY